MSKTQLIEELCSLCDSIAELAYQNQSKLAELKEKFPKAKILNQFELLTSEQFEDHTIATLRRYDVEQLSNFLLEANQHYEQMLSQQSDLDKMETNQDFDIMEPIYVQRQSLSNSMSQNSQNIQFERENWRFLLNIDFSRKQAMKSEEHLDLLIHTIQKLQNSMSIESEKAQKIADRMLKQSEKALCLIEQRDNYEEQSIKTKTMELNMKELQNRLQYLSLTDRS